MTPAEFEKKLQSLPEEEPDAQDLTILAEAKAENDGSTIGIKELEAYSGKLNIRIPRSLHQKLSQEAKADGVSLNQYILYKLAQ